MQKHFVDKITSTGRSKEVRSKELGSAVDPAAKPRSEKEKDETNIMEETKRNYIPPERRKQIIKDLKLF